MAGAHGRPVHRPVQLETVLRLLAPRPGARLLDATLGAGGHAEAWLEAESDTLVLGIDRDASILEHARRRLERFGGRLETVACRFSELGAELDRRGIESVDAVLFDLGASSLQLDAADRGFSFLHDGPLDMRMDPTSGPTAADIVNHASEQELARLLREGGDERRARTIARAIVAARRRAPLRGTLELADLVARALGRRGRRHPATRTFQALRIAVNDELDELRRALPAAIDRLAAGGRLVVLSFHSGEDRIVKRIFREAARARRARLLEDKPITARPQEVRSNPRARSSRLRAIERID